LPYGAAVNTEENPDNDSTYYFCDATSTAACSYTCPSGQECDGTSGCKDIPPSSCSGAPCGGGTAEDGEDLTCYQKNVQCTSTSTTAGEETHTCSGGYWDDEWENDDYKDYTPNLHDSSNCDSSYNSDSPQNDPH